MPAFARAEAVTTLKVEPGGNSPCSARSNPPGRSTTASTRPVDGWIATMSTGFVVEADWTAFDAASWSRISMLVRTGVPAWAAKRAAAVSRRFPGHSVRMVSAGQLVLVSLLDPALADLVSGLVQGAQRPGPGSGDRHHAAGQQ